ncbi:Rieske 2Fe-2S domain-containing protein [bacterium]|nr:Rieske 2Fe-2S domain-containing protein [bacterium]
MAVTTVNVCKKDDIEEGKTKIVEVNGREILLAKDQGEVFALGAYCSHDGGRMDADEVYDGQVECPRHGAMFDIRTGEATMMPAVYGIDSFDVEIKDGDVYIFVDME